MALISITVFGLRGHGSVFIPLPPAESAAGLIQSLSPGLVPASAIQQLPLPLAYLDGVNSVISGDLLDGLPTADPLHGDPGLELGAMGAALAHWWEPRSGAVPRLRG